MTPLTDAEIDDARRLAAMDRDDLVPAREIMVGMLIGSAIWLVLGMVLYFLLEGR